ncbi:MAG: cobalamin B12-binding domain-containing protein [Acidimicrobiia bacterium]
MSYSIDPSDAPVTRIALLAALVDGDLATAYRVAIKLLDEGVPFEALVSEVLGPVQRELGRRWAQGDLTVADEHASTAAAEDLVTLLSSALSPFDGPVVLVVCPEGDAHSLPARAVAAVLALRGFRSRLLGASLPAADLGDYLTRQPTLAVALSISMPAALYRAAASVAVAHDHGVPVVVGGSALPDDDVLARRLGADAWAGSADAAADVLDEWRTRSPKPLTASVPVPGECVEIDVHRAALIAAAVPPDEPDAGRDLVDEVGRILDVAQGALLLDRPSLLTDQLGAAGAVRAGHGATEAALERVLERLTTATSEPLPAAAELLREAAAHRS